MYSLESFCHLYICHQVSYLVTILSNITFKPGLFSKNLTYHDCSLNLKLTRTISTFLTELLTGVPQIVKRTISLCYLWLF